jgi:outer membrane protein
MKRFKIILVVACGVLQLNLAAQEVWPLAKCIQTAWNNNLAIQSAKLNLKSNAIDVKVAEQAKYPTLSAGSNVSWNFGRTIDPTTNEFINSTFFNNGLNLNSGVTLYNGGAIKNNVLKSQNTTKALNEDLEQTKNDIALNVASLYLNALFAKENQAIAEANVKQSNTSLSQIQTLIRTGNRAPNEVLDIEAQLATDEQSLLNNRNSYINAIMQLKQAMLINDDIDIEAPNGVVLSTDADLLTFDEVYKSALTSQHNIAADEIRLIGTDLDIKIANANNLPTVGFGGSLGTNYSNKGQYIDGFETVRQSQTFEVEIPNFPKQNAILSSDYQVPILKKSNYFKQFQNNLSYGVGFNINMPIFNNYQSKASVQRAKLNKENVMVNLENKKQDLRVRVQKALTDAKAAKGAVVAAEKSVTANQAAFDNASKRFSLGSINSFDLTTARTRLDNAKNNLVIAKYDHIFKVKIVEFYQGKSITL